MHDGNADFSDIILKASSDPEIIAVVLFGSRLNRERYRDTDICLFTKGCLKRDKRMEYLSCFGDKYDIQVFSELPLYIRANVLKDGRILLDKDYHALFDIYRETIQAFDLFKPHFDAFLGVQENG